MLNVMSGGHTIAGEWNTEGHWEMSTGLGYRNTGIRVPITANTTSTYREPGVKTGLGFDPDFLPKTRRRWEPIQFVPAGYVKDQEHSDQLHAPWVATPPF